MSLKDLACALALAEEAAAAQPVKPGPPGRDGKDGQDGKDGVGKDGRDGRDGHGKDGKDGQDGQDGRDGRDGRDAAWCSVASIAERDAIPLDRRPDGLVVRIRGGFCFEWISDTRTWQSFPLRGIDGRDGRDGKNGVGSPGPAGRDGRDGRGLPKGGRRGQALIKLSDKDFDVGWATRGGGGGRAAGGGAGASTADAVACAIPGRSDLTTVADALAALFFVPLSVALSGGGTYELGQSITSRELTWTASKDLASQTLAGIARDPTDRAATMVGPFTTDTTWTLSAVAASGETVTASAALAFRSRRHWGVSASETLDDAAILALAGSELAAARQQTRTLDATGGCYLWFAWPSDFGAPAFWIGGLLNTAWTETVRDVVNAYGHSRSYRIYRSASIQHGAAITVEVR